MAKKKEKTKTRVQQPDKGNDAEGVNFFESLPRILGMPAVLAALTFSGWQALKGDCGQTAASDPKDFFLVAYLVVSISIVIAWRRVPTYWAPFRPRDQAAKLNATLMSIVVIGTGVAGFIFYCPCKYGSWFNGILGWFGAPNALRFMCIG